MTDNARTSGDIMADRRFAYAEGMAADKDYAAAADLAQQALELVPHWAAGWFKLGEYNELAANRPAAIVAYAKCLELNQDDRLGAALKLALLQGREVSAPALGYTEALFDEYADTFDTALVGRLNYRAPQLLKAILDENLSEVQHKTVLDLGCGTGLMGAVARPACEFLKGIDLSSRMLEKARSKNIYDQLAKSDLLDCLDTETNMSMIIAADVFMYMPGLERVFAAAAKALATGGYFLFSVEKAIDPHTWTLLPSRRYAHGEDYVRNLLAVNGFTVIDHREDIIRMDAGLPLTGLLWLARLDAAQP